MIMRTRLSIKFIRTLPFFFKFELHTLVLSSFSESPIEGGQ